jgi:hypothetical protein
LDQLVDSIELRVCISERLLEGAELSRLSPELAAVGEEPLVRLWREDDYLDSFDRGSVWLEPAGHQSMRG